MTPRVELGRLIATVGRLARRKAWLGVRRVPRSEADVAATAPVEPVGKGAQREQAQAPAPRASSATPPSRAQAPKPQATPLPAPPTLATAEACADLDALRAKVAGCTACDLCQSRKQTVFSDGSPRARVLFIGEAPGQNEDEQGVPFVGRAGHLLTDIIQKGMGLGRDEVYIANVLKCRPPDNRDPTPEEKRHCTPFLDRQIELVNPDILITLGAHASQHVLERKDSMGRLRGRVHERRGRKVVATYHPAYLLRSPSQKRACWEDIMLAMKELGLPMPSDRGGSA